MSIPSFMVSRIQFFSRLADRAVFQCSFAAFGSSRTGNLFRHCALLFPQPLNLFGFGRCFGVLAVLLGLHPSLRGQSLDIQSPQSLPPGIARQSYSHTFEATGGQPPYTWRISARNTLPTNFGLAETTGILKGTATSVSTYSFTVQVRDRGGRTKAKIFKLAFQSTPRPTPTPTPSPTPAPTPGSSPTPSPSATSSPTPSDIPYLSATTIPNGSTKAAFSFTFTAEGGTPPYQFDIVSRGTLPKAFVLDKSSGVMTGRQNTASTFSFQVRVRDSKVRQSQKRFTLRFVTGQAGPTPSPSPRVSPVEMVVVPGGTLPAAPGSWIGGRVVAAFRIAKREVTWKEWQEVAAFGATKGISLTNIGDGSGPNHPVRAVSWEDAVKWCNARSLQEGLQPYYSQSGTDWVSTPGGMAPGYRLPTEAEWEWAARAGKVGSITTNGTTHFSGGSQLNELGWYWENSINSTVDLFEKRGTFPVGQKKPNELGVFDMSGNVWEWCFDTLGKARIYRGGSWLSNARRCQVFNRDGAAPGARMDHVGFRLARDGTK